MRTGRAISVWWGMWSSMRQARLSRESGREALLVSSGGGVWGCVFGVMFTPDAPAGWGRISGGNSSYTGAPIPLEEMRQWQAATVERMGSSTRGGCWRLVWVLGCCWLSWLRGVCGVLGTDFSAPTIENLAGGGGRAVVGDRVRLRVQPADVAEGCRRAILMWWSLTRWSSTSRVGVSAGGGGAGDAVAGPGWGVVHRRCAQPVVVGGVHHGVVCADDAYGHSSSAVVRERIRREILAEQELLLAPEFFVALPDYLPDIAAVDVQLKRMHAVNELSGYRYEVVLRKAPVSVRSLAHVSRSAVGAVRKSCRAGRISAIAATA